jgi:hypothetical protein
VRHGDLMQLLTPLDSRQEDGGRADNGSSRRGRLTSEQQRRARSTVAAARALQEEFCARYGAMAPESWELLNESRDERTAGLSRAIEE